MSDPFDTGQLPPGLREEYLAGMRAVLSVLAAIGERLAAAGNDREALEMLQREAHKIHGSAGSYGFMDASRLAAGMEVTAKDWVAHSDDREMDRGSLTRWFVARLAEMLGLQVPRPPAVAPRPPVRGVGPPPRPSQTSAGKPIQPPRTVSPGVRAPPPTPAPTPAPTQRTPPAAPPRQPLGVPDRAPPPAAPPRTGPRPPPPTSRPQPQAPLRSPARPQVPSAPAPARPKPRPEPPPPSPAATELPWIFSPEAAAEPAPRRAAEGEPAASAPPAEPLAELPAAAQPEPPTAAPPAPVPPVAEAPAVQPEVAPAKPEPARSASPVEPVADAPGAPRPPFPAAAPVVAARAAASEVPEVIFVEDDAALAELLAYGLRARGYRFVAYRNGRDALRELIALDAQGTHPLLLLDVDLPALDGYSICAALQRERPGTYRVVFTTVHGSEEEQLRGLEAGALDYLVKPISLRVALEKIKRWVGR